MTRLRIGVFVLTLLFAADVTIATAQDVGAGIAVDGPTAAAEVEQEASPALSLQPSVETSVLLAGVPMTDADLFGESAAPSTLLMQEKNKAGIPFMIAGGAAFVAGLIIGGDVGTVVAVAGVGIGVYGIILYF